MMSVSSHGFFSAQHGLLTILRQHGKGGESWCDLSSAGRVLSECQGRMARGCKVTKFQSPCLHLPRVLSPHSLQEYLPCLVGWIRKKKIAFIFSLTFSQMGTSLSFPGLYFIFSPCHHPVVNSLWQLIKFAFFLVYRGFRYKYAEWAHKLTRILKVKGR